MVERNGCEDSRLGRAVAVLALAVCVALPVAVSGQAAEQSYTTLKVDVPTPDAPSEDVAGRARGELSDRVIDRIETRLDTAGVKFSSVEKIEPGLIEISVPSDLDRGLLAGIAVPAGRFALRPVEWVGSQWVDLIGSMPPGVELRQSSESLATDRAYLWSDRRRPLESFAERSSLSEGETFVYPHGEGWRTVVLGAPAIETSDVEGATIRSVPNGTPFVSIDLEAGAVESLESVDTGSGVSWAAVLDGEVVALMDGLSVREGAVHIMAPRHFDGRVEETTWARQVGGRLSATIPVALVAVD